MATAYMERISGKYSGLKCSAHGYGKIELVDEGRIERSATFMLEHPESEEPRGVQVRFIYAEIITDKETQSDGVTA